MGEFSAMMQHGDRYVLDLRNGYRYLPKSLRALLDVDSALKLVIKADWGRLISNASTPATRWWRNAARLHHKNVSGEVAIGGTVMQRVQATAIIAYRGPLLDGVFDRSACATS
jgi:hypothetical protein